jgi:hypothetical protein
MAQKPELFKKSLAFPNRSMVYLYSQIEQQQRILKQIKTVLPDNLAKQTKHCLIKDHNLLVYTDSAIWASQLRFYNSAILASIQTLVKSPINNLQIKIISRASGVTETAIRKANLASLEGIDLILIRTHSLSISDDKLSVALLKLSTTLKRLADST